MAEKNKRTQREIFEEMLGLDVINSNPDYKNLIEKKLEELKKKAENRKPTETQKKNAEIGRKAIEYLSAQNTRLTITQLQVALDVPSNQRLSRIMSDAYKNGTVNKVSIKGVSYYEPLGFKAE